MSGKIEELHPKRYIIVEGFLLLKYARIRRFFDLTIYLDIPPELMVVRRSIRSIGAPSMEEYDRELTIPQFMKHGAPQREFADVVIDARPEIRRVLAEVRKTIRHGCGNAGRKARLI